jgi:type VI secretion system protein ImpA
MNAHQWDSQQLSQPVTAEHACGENLEDTPLLASFDGFRLFGHSTPLNPVPDWDQVKDRSLEALARSKDLRLLAHLAAALLRTDGLCAFSQTLAAAADWLDSYWNETYPCVDEDAILRRNALNCFADPMAVIDGLRRLPLAESRQHGRFSLRDIDIAAGLQPDDSDTGRDEAQINAAFSSMPLEQVRLLEQGAADALAALKRIDARMREQGGAEAAPTFDALSVQLVRMHRVIRAQVAARTEAGDGTGVPDGIGPASSGANGGSALVVGPVRSRADATRALDAVSEFFRQQEPSSPIPLLVERAKRLVSKDFLEVLADVAPDALAQARAAGGLRRE